MKQMLMLTLCCLPLLYSCLILKKKNDTSSPPPGNQDPAVPEAPEKIEITDPIVKKTRLEKLENLVGLYVRRNVIFQPDLNENYQQGDMFTLLTPGFIEYNYSIYYRSKDEPYLAVGDWWGLSLMSAHIEEEHINQFLTQNRTLVEAGTIEIPDRMRALSSIVAQAHILKNTLKTEGIVVDVYPTVRDQKLYGMDGQWTEIRFDERQLSFLLALNQNIAVVKAYVKANSVKTIIFNDYPPDEDGSPFTLRKSDLDFRQVTYEGPIFFVSNLADFKTSNDAIISQMAANTLKVVAVD